jgi:hypothetical protein
MIDMIDQIAPFITAVVIFVVVVAVYGGKI